MRDILLNLLLGESGCPDSLCSRLTLKDEGAQDRQVASAWVVVPKDTDLSWRTAGRQQTRSIPRAQQDGRRNGDASNGLSIRSRLAGSVYSLYTFLTSCSPHSTSIFWLLPAAVINRLQRLCGVQAVL